MKIGGGSTNKKGAIELSIGTIVIIVLSMSMLILGLVLIRGIFFGAIDITEMTDSQLKDEVSKLFGEEKKLVVYPDTRHIEIKSGDISGFGIGIKNLLTGVQNEQFSYEVVVSDPDIESKCGVSEQEALDWISPGRAETDIGLAPGEFVSGKVLLTIPEGSRFCTFRYRINVLYGESAYASELMDVTIGA
jgi:hypothetical protein